MIFFTSYRSTSVWLAKLQHTDPSCQWWRNEDVDTPSGCASPSAMTRAVHEEQCRRWMLITRICKELCSDGGGEVNYIT